MCSSATKEITLANQMCIVIT